ncbi:hypothetical protein FDECE_4381 [Fusarium decemcellulare]|nr:hypothetical protein FDECE_4381 [Fusarium decemcellulare]
MPRPKKDTAQYVVKPPPKKRGPKPKPLSERVYKPAKPITRIENSYTQKRKEEVILYMLHHEIYDPNSWKSVNCYRKPFIRDAAEHFKIPDTTVGTWWRHKDKILNKDKNKKRRAKNQLAAAPEESEPVQDSESSAGPEPDAEPQQNPEPESTTEPQPSTELEPQTSDRAQDAATPSSA